MKTHFLVLSDSDWGRRISLSKSCDQIISESAAHAMAAEFGQKETAFLYRLEAVYRPAYSREIPEILVPSNKDIAVGGTD